MTAEKLQEISQENLKLTSVLFLHKITDNRLMGSSKRLQRVYEKVYGHEAFGSVVLSTTMWGDLGRESDGVRREGELIHGNFWGKMIRGGTECYRSRNSGSSVRNLANVLVGKKPVETQLQRELEWYNGALIHAFGGSGAGSNICRACSETGEKGGA